ncbi:carbohydrate kinase family protein [Kribbella amoyensis]|uniref:carbohydrate kinase family protein n=1 Tax=Kribbella amoyensis TaxID=996641 RepID=UPI00192D3B3E|nr:carbohydrate kinase family protein [Kribbella amoyensis]
MEIDVLVIGGAGIDTIVRVPELPLPGRETLSVEPIRSYVGHTGHGVTLGCHLLGLNAALADVLGNDAEGAQVVRLYDELRLPLFVTLHPSGTRRSVNLVSPDGRRQSLYDGRSTQAIRVDPALWRTQLRRTRHVHVSIMDFARQALPDLAASQCTVSTDLHDWDGRNPYHQDFARAADVVFVSAGNLPDDATDWIFVNGRAQVVVVMDGSKGSYVHARDAKPVHIPPVDIPERPVVDSNGAGDAYVAAFLTLWLDGHPWQSAAEAASIAGAWACGSPGTHTDLITAEELAARR